jgi:hypothetical protein
MDKITTRLIVISLFILLILVTGSYIAGFENNSENTEADQEKTDLLLPDLVAIPPEELFIEVAPGVRNIRFSTTFANIGEGPLELRSEHDHEKLTTLATQNISTVENGRIEEVVGEFVFHPDHDHWHIENYIQFTLIKQTPKGVPDEIVAQTDKMSFCIWDEASYDNSLENFSPVQQYVGCENEIQGISVGWSDTYRASVEGQEMDIREVEDGEYTFRMQINPDRNIRESDYTNNIVELKVEIEGNSIRIVED